MVTQFAPCGTVLYIETALYAVCAYMYVLSKSSQECIYKTSLTFKQHQEFKFSLIVVFGYSKLMDVLQLTCIYLLK